MKYDPGVILIFASVLACCFGAAESGFAEQPQPNIVVILADDLGYGDLGCYGNVHNDTPHLDRLAREGMRLTDFHSNGPMCSPTRAALLLGRYQHRIGIESAISTRGEQGLPEGEQTLAEALRAAGYATAVFGKWHLGKRPEFLPTRHGFDEFRGLLCGCGDYRSHIDRNGNPDWWRGWKDISSNGLCRGQKGQLYEGGHRVPALFWWPGRIKPGSTIDETAMTMDLFPTCLELAGLELPPSDSRDALDGVSLAPLLLENKPLPERTLFWRMRGQKAVRRGPWKLVVQPDGKAELYSLADDLGETRNLAAKHAEVVDRLLDELARWEALVKRKTD